MQFFRAHLREGWLFCPRGDFPVFRKEAEKCNIRKLHSQDFSWGEGVGEGGMHVGRKGANPMRGHGSPGKFEKTWIAFDCISRLHLVEENDTE